MSAFQQQYLDGMSPENAKTPLTDTGFKDAIVEIAKGFIQDPYPDSVLNQLTKTIAWEQRNVKVYRKIYPQPRLVAWYGSDAYTYSGIRFEPKAMTPLLKWLLLKVEAETDQKFNSVLLNRYVAGQNHGMGHHADNEPELGRDPIIAMLTFGEGRALEFKPRKWMLGKYPELKLRSVETPSGSLLVMRGATQRTWTHGLPKARGQKDRITLTFRTIKN